VLRPRIYAAPVAAALVMAACVAAASPAHAATCVSPFTSAFRDDLARRYPRLRVTAAVYDTASGCWYHLHHGMRISTASVIKAQIMGAVLLKAQDARRPLTTWERDRIRPMIRYSFNNPPTSDLYLHVGGASGMESFDRRAGVTATDHTATYGGTVTTAVDRTKIALRLLYSGRPLGLAARTEAWAYLSDVHPTQRWGITAGVPNGWEVALKNGFYPSRYAGWRVGSSGFVRRTDADHGYAITVMTDRGPDHFTGMRLVETVSRRVAAALTVGPQHRRVVDRARCTRTTAGESWGTVASRLGVAARWRDVRTVSGGNPSPLTGQRACSPDLAPEPSSGSTVGGRYQPVVSDLDCDRRDDIVWYRAGSRSDVIWRGRADRRFTSVAADLRRRYVPVAGDFDGDGCGDVLWYGPGAAADRLWSGGPTGVTNRAITVYGIGYAPAAGDFDGDGRDDVLWYRPRDGRCIFWFGTASRGRFAAHTVTGRTASIPVVLDANGDGASDLIWYAPGRAPDRLWRARPGQRASFTGADLTVNGRYRPVVTNVDGVGADEVLWYAPGAPADPLWSGVPPATGSRPLDIRPDYLPLGGDFDGDGHGDIAWYGPGGLADRAWWGGAEPASFTTTGLTRR